MDAVNPNLAMTNCPLDTEQDYNVTEVGFGELNSADDIEPEICMWDESDVYESEPVTTSDANESLELSVDGDKSENPSAECSPAATTYIVSCTTKVVHQQPTIIVARASGPTSYISSPVAQVSKAKVKPTTVTIDGSSGVVFRNDSAVILSSAENCLG